MALTEIQNGTLADATVINNNFDYLDDRITDTANRIYTNNAQFESQIATISSNIGGCNSDIDSLEDSVSTISGDISTINSNISTLQSKNMFPDYSKGSSLSSGTTTTKDGWVRAYMYADYGTGGSIQVNGVTVAACGFDRTEDYSGEYWSAFFPVAAGSTITYSGFSNHHGVKNVVFYPCIQS